MNKNDKDYILTEVKYQNTYFLYNGIDNKTKEAIKDLIYKKQKNIDNSIYVNVICEELFNVCYDLLEKQLKLIYSYIHPNNDEKEEMTINTFVTMLPKNIVNLLEKNASSDNVLLRDVVNYKKEHNYNVFNVMNYNTSAKEILEMFFDTENYEKAREKFLNREDGREEALLLEQVKLGMFN